MSFGKTIELFLVDGSFDGIVTAELSNWNGKAIKLPRTEVATCKREDLEKPGIYFLLCKEEDGTDSLYIGEAENVLQRLNQHLNDYKAGKEQYYWNTVVTFIGRDLNKALIRYLEHRSVMMARNSGKYKILTKNTYANTMLKESQIASMEEFIENVKVLIDTLGYRVFEEAPHATSKTEYLYCKGNNANVKGFVSTNGFTIVAGSVVSDHVADSFEVRAKTYFKLRNDLIEKGIIENRTFTKDYEFSSPSAAATVVLGHNANGNLDWKTEAGVKLKDL